MRRFLLLVLLLLPLLLLAVPVRAQTVQQFITFVSTRDHASYELYRMNTDGSNVIRLTDNGGQETYSRISSDGLFIVYGYYSGGNRSIWRMESDGSNPHQIVPGGTGDIHPALSSDDTYLAFASKRDTGDKYQLYTCLLESCVPTRITYNDSSDYFVPSYTQSDTRIEFNSDLGGTYGIHTVTTSGSGLTTIYDTSAEERFYHSCGNNIVYSTDEDGDWEIWTIEMSGLNNTRLTSNSSHDMYATYDPSCETIVFSSIRDGDWEIFRMDSDGSNVVQLTDDMSIDLYPAMSFEPQVIVPTPTPTVAPDMQEAVEHLQRSEERSRVAVATLLFMAVVVPVLLSYIVIRIRQK